MLILGLVNIPLWLLFIPVLTVLIYWYGTRNHSYFKKRGIPGPKPTAFMGVNIYQRNTDIYTRDKENIKTYGKVYGGFLGNNPELIVADPDMITEIAIKQFHKFSDRRPTLVKDKVLLGGLFGARGEKWKSTRAKISPTFTTGKIKLMSPEINRCANSFAKKMRSIQGPFDTKRLAEAYTMDVIASTAFGIQLDSQNEENSELSKHARKFIDLNFMSFKIFLAICLPPFVMDMLAKVGIKCTLFDAQSTNYFLSIIEQTLKNRSADEKRTDFLQLMVRAQEEASIHEKDNPDEKASNSSCITKDVILGNALLFFLAGFDSVSLSLTYLLYCLACNQDCQDRVIQEVDSVIGNEDGVKYEAMNKLHYLDQCLNESLRIYPPAIRVDRYTNCDTEVCGIKIEKGIIVTFPIYAIHHDSDIWPEPEKYDPERFSPLNKPNIKQSHWIPFGIGPRICIGMRQALLEIKVAVVEILKTHRLVTCDKTEIPVKLRKSKFMHPENEIWLALEPRN